MKLSRRELLAAGAASVAARVPAGSHSEPAIVPPPAGRSQKPVSYPSNLPIRDYLAKEARRITDNALIDLKTAADFTRTSVERRRRFMRMMGLADLQPPSARSPVPYKVTGTLDRPNYRIEKLHYESLPNLHVTANLYVPKAGASGARRPGVLYLCGHEPNQKVAYQAHPKRFAELGFPTLIVETVQLGEVTGHHHGCYQEGWFQLVTAAATHLPRSSY